MNTNCAQSNARWSALETTTSRQKSSDRLRNILYHQDFCRVNSCNSRMDSSSHTMPNPAIRRDSLDSLGSMGSMSTISSIGSYGSMSSRRFSSRKTSTNKLMRYSNSNRDSKNSLLSLNNRWRSTPPKKRNSKSINISKLLHTMVLSPVAMRGKHNGRWMATVSSDSAIDRPISVIQRKASLNTILPSSSNQTKNIL